MARGSCCASLLLLLVACATKAVPAEQPLFDELRLRLEQHQFEMVSPPRGDYRPGTAIDTAAQNTVVLTQLDTSAELKEAPALFLTDFRSDQSVSSALQILAHWGGQADDSQSRQAALELTRRGVQTIQIRFRDCTIQSMPLSPLQRLLNGLDTTSKRDFEHGAEVIVETIVASDPELTFRGQSEDLGQIGTQILSKVLGSKVEVRRTASTDYSATLSGRVCIGMKTRVLFAETGNELVAALELPRPLITQLRAARALMRAERFAEVGARFQELRGGWFTGGETAEYRDSLQNEVRLLDGVATMLRGEAQAKSDRGTQQALQRRASAIEAYARRLVQVANQEIGQTNAIYRRNKSKARIEPLDR